MLSHQIDYKPSETDELETTMPNAPAAESDSASSEDDAGINEINPTKYGDIDSATPPREIVMTDLNRGPHAGDLSSPEDSDQNSPGEVDIEQLDDNALADTDIPEDALLDRLEE